MRRKVLLNKINIKIEKIGKEYIKSQKEIDKLKKNLKGKLSESEIKEITHKIEQAFNYSGLLEDSLIFMVLL